MMYRAAKTTMRQAYPTMIDGDGVMTDLANLGVPWSTNSAVLDKAYYMHSAQRAVVPMLRLIGNEDGSLSDTSRVTVASIVRSMFLDRWTRVYNDYQSEYQPINNYDMTETETIDTDTTDTGTIGNQATHTGTNTTVQDNERHDTGTDTIDTDMTTAQSGTSSDAQNVYGFNSSTAVGDSTSSGTDSMNSTSDSQQVDTRNLVMTEDNTTTETRNLADNSTATRNLSGTADTSRTLTRRGNIGVTTTQRMLTEDIDLWLRDYFFNIVFRDIDSILTLTTYPRYSEVIRDEVL